MQSLPHTGRKYSMYTRCLTMSRLSICRIKHTDTKIDKKTGYITNSLQQTDGRTDNYGSTHIDDGQRETGKE